MSKSDQISRCIRRKGGGWVVTPPDFLDPGSPQTLGMVLLFTTLQHRAFHGELQISA